VLPPQSNHQSQCLLHSLFLGCVSRGLLGFSHEDIVDFDIGAHGHILCRVYLFMILYTFGRGRQSEVPVAPHGRVMPADEGNKIRCRGESACGLPTIPRTPSAKRTSATFPHSALRQRRLRHRHFSAFFSYSHGSGSPLFWSVNSSGRRSIPTSAPIDQRKLAKSGPAIAARYETHAKSGMVARCTR